MSVLRRIFVEDAGLKVLALAISFSLWAIYTSEPFAQVGYNVPIAFVNVPTGMVVSGVTAGNVPATVRVTLQGRSGLLRRLVPEDLNLNVDLSGARTGEVPVRLQPYMVHTPYGTEVIRMMPAQFNVMLIPTSTQTATPE